MPALSIDGEIDKYRALIALVFQLGRAHYDLVHVERLGKLELDAVVVLEHLETNGRFAADVLFIGVDADIEVIIDKIVIGAIPAVFAAKLVGVGLGAGLGGEGESGKKKEIPVMNLCICLYLDGFILTEISS